jgi:hypothetical protein
MTKRRRTFFEAVVETFEAAADPGRSHHFDANGSCMKCGAKEESDEAGKPCPFQGFFNPPPFGGRRR